jgi:hypothetical protein
MIFEHMPGDAHHILGADCTDEVAPSGAPLAAHGSPPISRDPHQMEMDFVDRRRAVAIGTYASPCTRAPRRAC